MRVCLALVLLAACGSDATTTAYFKISDRTEFYELPYPNDYWRKADGHPDLSQFPTNSLIAMNVKIIAERDLDGFGKNAAIFARFSAPLDEASLPDPAASLTDDASVYLVNVDPASPDHGQKTPVIVKFHPEKTQTQGDNRLAVRPYPGFPLDDGTTYALVITNRVHGADGGSISRDSDFSALVGSGGDAKAKTAFAPLFTYLDEAGGDERADVVSATVFTTQHATSFGPAIRKGVLATPAPVATDVVQASMGAAYFVFTGNYSAPNFQAGEAPYQNEGGEITIGTDGAAVVTHMESLRFALSVPPGATPATGFPIAIYSHGTGGDWKSFLDDGTGAQLAAQGIATISMDQVLHGPRNPAGTSPEVAFFNFNNPVAGRDNPLQGAADALSQHRLALGLTITDSNNRVIKFDPNRVFFFGHSQGGLTGPAYIAFDPDLKGAVLSGTGGTFYLSLLTKTEPLNFPDLVETLIRDQPIDEDNPSLALAQMALERSDGVNYAPLMVRKPPAGVPPKNIFQTEGFTDHYSPNAVIEAFATAIGGDIVQLPDTKELEGMTLRGRTVKPAPFTDNVDNVTAVLAQYKQAGTSDGHFVVFDVASAKKQSSQFLGTLAATGQATVVSP
jgi:pimeloyl-ACP methyl ester carboxylesterase